LGDKRFAATRINLAQSCNGVGWMFGPIVGSMFFYSKDALGQHQTLYIPYVGIAAGVLVLSVIFLLAPMPDIKTEDDYHLDDPGEGSTHSICRHRHFVLAMVAQFLYVAAKAGIFSFFINYMTAEVPAIPSAWGGGGFWKGWLETRGGILAISNQGAANLASGAFLCFLIGRATGAALLKKYSAHMILALYGALNVVTTLVVFLKLGWISVACVFLSYFFMSIMFPTIFALGIFGLGARAKKASAFIVMAIMGGAVLPKLMGAVADKWDMSRGFIVPMFCFVFVALYGWNWPRLAKAESLADAGVKLTASH